MDGHDTSETMQIGECLENGTMSKADEDFMQRIEVDEAKDSMDNEYLMDAIVTETKKGRNKTHVEKKNVDLSKQAGTRQNISSSKWSRLKKKIRGNKRQDLTTSKIDLFKLVPIEHITMETSETSKVIVKGNHSIESFETCPEKQEKRVHANHKSNKTKAYIPAIYDPQYLPFSEACYLLPICDPAKMIIGFEQYYAFKSSYQLLYIRKSAFLDLIDRRFCVRKPIIRTRLFFNELALRYMKPALHKLRRHSIYIKYLLSSANSGFRSINGFLLWVILKLQTDFYVNRIGFSIVYPCSFLITLFGLLANSDLYVWFFLNATILLSLYISVIIVSIVSTGIDNTLRTPCIPIPDFLVLKIYKRRIDLHFLIWKESFSYAGNDTIGLKFVDSEFVPFKTNAKLKRYLYIFPRKGEKGSNTATHMQNFRLSFYAAYRRLFNLVRHLEQVNLKFTQFVQKGGTYEKSLEQWRLGVHAKGNSLSQPDQLKRISDQLSRNIFICFAEGVARRKNEEAIKNYVKHLILRLCYCAVEHSNELHRIATKGMKTRLSDGKPLQNGGDSSDLAISDEDEDDYVSTAIPSVTNFKMYDELQLQLEIPESLFEEISSELRQQIPDAMMDVAEDNVNTLLRDIKEGDKRNDALDALTNKFLAEKNKLIEKQLLSVFVADCKFTLPYGEQIVQHCLALTVQKYQKEEHLILFRKLELHLITSEGEIDLARMYAYFDSVGAKKKRESKKTQEKNDNESFENLAVDNGKVSEQEILDHYLNFVCNNRHLIPCSNESIPSIFDKNIFQQFDRGNVTWVCLLCGVFEYWTIINILFIPMIGWEQNGGVVSITTSSALLLADNASVDYTAIKIWFIVLVVFAMTVYLYRLLDNFLYESHPEWMSTLGYIIRATIRRMKHNAYLDNKEHKIKHDKHDKQTIRRLQKQSKLRRSYENFKLKYFKQSKEMQSYFLNSLLSFGQKLSFGMDSSHTRERATAAIFLDANKTKTILNIMLATESFSLPLITILLLSYRCNRCKMWAGLTSSCTNGLQVGTAIFAVTSILLLIIFVLVIFPLIRLSIRYHNFFYTLSIAKRKVKHCQYGSLYMDFNIGLPNFSLAAEMLESTFRFCLVYNTIVYSDLSPIETSRWNIVLSVLYAVYISFQFWSVTFENGKKWLKFKIIMGFLILVFAVIVSLQVDHFSAIDKKSLQSTFTGNATNQTNSTSHVFNGRRTLLQTNETQIAILKERDPICIKNVSGNPLPSCDFDDTYIDPNSLPCGFTNDVQSKVNWTLNTGETDTRGTGPLEGDWGSPSYLYAESSHDYLRWGDKAIVDTPFFLTDLKKDAECKLKFSFHMRGGKDNLAGMGKLKVFQRFVNCTKEDKVLNDTWQLLFSRHGNMGFDWNYTQVPIVKGEFPTQIRFVAVIHGTTSDIAIDSILVTCTYPPVMPPITPPFIPPPSCWSSSENVIIILIAALCIPSIYQCGNLFAMVSAGGSGPHCVNSSKCNNLTNCIGYFRNKQIKLCGFVELGGLHFEKSTAELYPVTVGHNSRQCEHRHFGFARDSTSSIRLTITYLQNKKKAYREDRVARIAIFKPLQTLRTDSNLKRTSYYYRRTDKVFTVPKHNKKQHSWRHDSREDQLPSFQFSSIHDLASSYFFVTFLQPAIIWPQCGKAKKIQGQVSYRINPFLDEVFRCHEEPNDYTVLVCIFSHHSPI